MINKRFLMNKNNLLQHFEKYFGDRYVAYLSSIKSEKENYFFIVKDKKKKYLVVFAVDAVAQKFEGSV